MKSLLISVQSNSIGFFISDKSEKRMKKMIPVPSFKRDSSSQRVLNLSNIPSFSITWTTSFESVIETIVPKSKAAYQDNYSSSYCRTNLRMQAKIPKLSIKTGNAKISIYQKICLK